MHREQLVRRFTRDSHVVLAVVHVLDNAQAERNVRLALEGRAHGVLLINHDFGPERFLPIIRHVRASFPSAWLGVNFLAVPLRAASVTLGELTREGVTIDGYWADDAQIDELAGAENQMVAQWAKEARAKSGWKGLYFGGTCFKKQRPVHPARVGEAARLASMFMDCVTTSGTATGEAAELRKINDMRRGCGDSAMAIASGLTPENVTTYMPLADVFIVATGISEPGDFHNLSAARLEAFMGAIQEAEPVAASAKRHKGSSTADLQEQRMRRYLPLMGPNTRGLENFAWLDPSRMYTHAAAWRALVDELLAPFSPGDVDVFAGIDAAGFPLAGAMALKWGKGVLTMRKAGKLCCDVDAVDYGGTVYAHRSQTLEMRKPAFVAGTKVLIVDQWIETGGTMGAAIKLVERQGGIVVGIASVGIEDTETSRELRQRFKCSAASSVGRDFAASLLPMSSSPSILSGGVPGIF